jgi:hypothetical protein
VLLELFGLLFFTYIASVLSSTAVFLGVVKVLSTEKQKRSITVEKPGEKPRRECLVCGAHEWLELPRKEQPKGRHSAE